MKNENSKDEEEIISIGNIQEEENMLHNLEDNNENINMSDSNDKTKSDNEPLYVMSLELAKGKKEQIKIYSNSNSAELAFNFCKANNLDLSALTYLKEEIDKLMVKKPLSNQDDDTPNQYEQSNVLSRDSNRSSNLQTSKFLSANIQKHLEGDDISSIINKNPSQISKDDNSLSESLFSNIINSSTSKGINNANNSIHDIKNSFSFTTMQQKKTISSFSKISQNRNDNEKNNKRERKRDVRENSNRYLHHNHNNKPSMKSPIVTPNSNPFVNISQSSIKRCNSNARHNNNNANYTNIVYDKSKKKSKGQNRDNKYYGNCKQNNHSNNKYINKHIDEIKKETKKMFTFRPQINTSNQFHSQLTFLQRQEQFSSLVIKKTHNLSNLIYSNEDDPLFRPKLISKQRRENNSSSNNNGDGIVNNVFDKNFEYAIRYRKKRQLYSNQYYNDITKQVNPIPESNKIVSHLYLESFKQIFSKMDIDNDGIITSFNYTLNKLPNEITKIIQPIINEMKISNHQLNQSEFVFIMDYLCSNNELALEDKKTLLDYNKKTPKNSSIDYSLNNNHKPFDQHINSKSRKLAVKHQKKMIRSLSAKNIISERPSRQITKEKYFINQSTANTERKMSSK